MKRFVNRKVRNGRVKVEGKWFSPSVGETHRFDGKKYMFFIYRDSLNQEIKGLGLWGSVYNYKIGEHNADDELLIDEKGKLKWAFWNKV